MKQNELHINGYYWILTGAGVPVKRQLIGYNHNNTCGLFATRYGRTDYPISRKLSEIYRTEEDARKAGLNMKPIHQIPVHESRNSDKVIKFYTEKDVNDTIVSLIENGELWGLYYTKESGDSFVVAEDKEGHIIEDILR